MKCMKQKYWCHVYINNAFDKKLYHVKYIVLEWV